MSTPIFTFTGDFGAGKTMTALSFIPNKRTGKKPVYRLLVDPEIRSGTYASPDGTDHPEKQQFAFEVVNGEKRLTGTLMYALMERAHNGSWKEERVPDVLIIDDLAAVQEILNSWWQDKNNVLAVAKLYNMQGDRALGFKEWRPKDPGSINFFKRLLEEFMLDMKEQGITLIVTSPFHNKWQGYGETGYGPDGKPRQRILGKTVKMWDCWSKMTDVIWVFRRKQGDNSSLSRIPTVEMDQFVAKAAFPGVPEQFEWPGWVELWRWHNERIHVADTTKLKKPTPEFDPEELQRKAALDLKADKHKLIDELKGVLTVDQIAELIKEDLCPPYETPDDHNAVKEFVVRLATERGLIAKVIKK